MCDRRGRIMVDYVGRLERMDETLEVINRQTGLALANIRKRTSKRAHFSEYFDERTERVVYDMYREDFEIFGYERLA